VFAISFYLIFTIFIFIKYEVYTPFEKKMPTFINNVHNYFHRGLTNAFINIYYYFLTFNNAPKSLWLKHNVQLFGKIQNR